MIYLLSTFLCVESPELAAVRMKELQDINLFAKEIRNLVGELVSGFT